MAFSVDSLALATLGALIGFWFFDWACRLGPYGRILGFAVMPLYFGICSSEVTKGQSIGKALLRIRVGAVDANAVSVHRGIGRAAILTWPYLLNGWAIKPMLEWPVLAWAASFVLFGVGGSIVYLFLFNRSTGQSFHDLIAGTAVSSPDAQPLGRQPPLPTVHRVAVGALLVLPIVLGGVGFLAQGWFDARLGPHKELWSQLNEDSRFHSVSVRYNTHRSGGSTVTSVTIHAWLKDEPFDRQSVATELASRAIAHYGTEPPDKVRITLQRGYDFGFSSGNRLWGDSRAPEGWSRAEDDA